MKGLSIILVESVDSNLSNHLFLQASIWMGMLSRVYHYPGFHLCLISNRISQGFPSKIKTRGHNDPPVVENWRSLS